MKRASTMWTTVARRRSLSEKGEQGPCFGQGAHRITSLRGVYSQHRKRCQIGEAAAKEHLAPLPGAARVASRQERAMNPVEIAALDALDLLVVVDNESDTLSSVDKGVPQLPELGRLVARVPHLAPKDGHDCVEPWGHLCLACHGFSALVTGRRGSEERSVLFDVGPSAKVWLENARRLGVRLASIEVICLSHWHADHSGGFPGVVAAISRARLEEGR